MMRTGPRAISYGGGVQSTALLVLAAQRAIDYRTALFCNVGEDSESPDTLRYVREVALPFAAAHGLALHELARRRRDGSADSILQRLQRDERSIGIPMRLPNGAPCNRSCTGDFKIKVTARWLRAHGATAHAPGTVALGISVDEFGRARTQSGFVWEQLDYPLLTLRLNRLDCRHVIERAGLPVPPKSSCWFCPLRARAHWQDLREHDPALFARAVALEEQMSTRHQALGRGPLYFHRTLRPLPLATTDARQLPLFDDDDAGCESGYCLV